MKIRRNERKTDGLLVLLLFAVFAVCVLSVLLTGADAYRGLAARDQTGYERRTAGQYLVTRLHQSDVAGAVTVEQFGGVDALVITERYDGELYQTRIYCHGGYLRELFTVSGTGFLPSDGEKILEAERMTLKLEDGLLTAELTDTAGQTQVLSVYLRSREEASA